MKHTLLQETFPAVSIEKKVNFPAKGGVLYNHRLCVNGVHTLFKTYVSYLRRVSLEVYISIIKKGKSSKELPKELLTGDYLL
jgi:hypothetical protein